MPPKVREAIRIVEDDGWYHVRTRGSHRQFKHPFKRRLVTIPGKLGADLREETWRSILKQAELPRIYGHEIHCGYREGSEQLCRMFP